MALYDGDALIQSSSDSVLPDANPYPNWKQEEHALLLDAVARLGVHEGALLDVGCFSGMFLENAKKRGFSVVGVEPNREAFVRLRNQTQLDVLHGSLSSARFSADRFSVVSLLDVIEHVSDPVAELQEAFRVLRPGGILVLTTPNVAGIPQRVVKAKRRLFRQEWCPIDDVPWHLWGFTASTLSRCVENAAFKVRLLRWLKPSQLTTNIGAGSSLAKRVGLRMLGEASRAPYMSDRMALFSQK
ncbi:MAG: class I SAM-dependent methyltransferase [Candidatus Acidiferrales bacterium]